MKAPIYFIAYVEQYVRHHGSSTIYTNDPLMPKNIIIAGETPIDWLASQDMKNISIIFWADITKMESVPDNIYNVVKALT